MGIMAEEESVKFISKSPWLAENRRQRFLGIWRYVTIGSNFLSSGTLSAGLFIVLQVRQFYNIAHSLAAQSDNTQDIHVHFLDKWSAIGIGLIVAALVSIFFGIVSLMAHKNAWTKRHPKTCTTLAVIITVGVLVAEVASAILLQQRIGDKQPSEEIAALKEQYAYLPTQLTTNGAVVIAPSQFNATSDPTPPEALQKTIVLNALQMMLHCCGTEADYEDFHDGLYHNQSFPLFSAPVFCCHFKDPISRTLTDRSCYFDTYRQSQTFQRGCVDAVKEYRHSTFPIMLTVIFGSIVLKIVRSRRNPSIVKIGVTDRTANRESNELDVLNSENEDCFRRWHQVIKHDGEQHLGSSCSYEKDAIIGQGRYGRVYKARIMSRGDFTGPPVVAVKELIVQRQADTLSLTNEAYAQKWEELLRLRHENVMAYHKVSFFTSGTAMRIDLLMDLMQGGDLARYISDRNAAPGTMFLITAVEFARQISGGLSYLHTNNIIHGDLKPANVLLRAQSDRCTLFIGDLDERIVMQSNLTCSVDVTHSCGTARYMSPEMIKKFAVGQTDLKIGRKTDVWSLGCIMIDLVDCCSGMGEKWLWNKETADEFQIMNAVMDNVIFMKLLEGYVPLLRCPIIPDDYGITCLIDRALSNDSQNRISSHDLFDKLDAMYLHMCRKTTLKQ
ncbi:uncharacterized protein LOC129596869 isoform X2 [Paramacrobiotus metropolitanus]|uniref:uncharacterized protein LOC129596869 isoform X2 n=1 Tax=Paramacrobiotus metropolitanus TaxID=2943436 RepID=UPI002445BBCE|nr:uncharacterized protein LOC129596869 isoform X2 [Paramacrobiotus metropolitanus]